MYALYTNSTCGMKLQREEILDVNQSPGFQPALSDQIRNPRPPCEQGEADGRNPTSHMRDTICNLISKIFNLA